jgi:GST-like protein
MIELYTWPTPNGHKVHIMLEECGLEYNVHPIDITAGDQFDPEFLKISPNNKMPAMVDPDGPGGKPYPVFESGAMLIYLAEKTGKFMPNDLRGRTEVLEWLMWQMGGMGPMFGQAGHFRFYAPEQIAYAKERYDNEMHRLYGVLDRRLEGRDYIAGDYSIADMACWPWVITYKQQEVDLDAYPNVKRWYKSLQQRPALRRGYDVGREFGRPTGTWDEEARKNLMAHPNPGGQ